MCLHNNFCPMPFLWFGDKKILTMVDGIVCLKCGHGNKWLGRHRLLVQYTGQSAMHNEMWHTFTILSGIRCMVCGLIITDLQQPCRSYKRLPSGLEVTIGENTENSDIH
jgi:hypothetical protein